MSIGKYYYGARFVTNGGDDTEYVMGDGTLSDGTGLNQTIGTDDDLTTSGATVVDDIVLTDGVVISHSTRTLTLNDLNFTGDSNANYYIHPDYVTTNINTSGSTIIDSITTNSTGHITSMGTRTLSLSDLGYTAPDLSGYLLNTSDTFTGTLTVDGRINGNGQQLVLNAGESSSYPTGQINEFVYINAESGLQINSSPDNWSGGWAGRNITTINDTSGNSTFAGDITVSGGDITLGGTGRIQGVDTVSSSTDAANKAYVDTRTPLDHIRSLGTISITNGTDPSINTTQLISEIEQDGAFDSYTSVFKTSWSYGGNYNLTDAGRFTETAGTSWITWTDNSSDSTRGNITALAIAPTTGGSAGKVFIYNDQGSSYAPGWREVWTSTSDGAGSGLDADKLDAQEGTYYLDYNNFTNTPSIPGAYEHPTHAGDDIDIDTGALSGAVVISDLDFNVTTNTLGHVTDANGTVSTRTLTLGDLGYTGDANANEYIHPTYNTTNINTSGSTIIDSITTNSTGHITAMGTRVLTLTDLGYSAPDLSGYLLNTTDTLTGTLTATSFVKSGGTAGQYLMADGSISTGDNAGVTSLVEDTTDGYEGIKITNGGSATVTVGLELNDIDSMTNPTGFIVVGVDSDDKNVKVEKSQFFAYSEQFISSIQGNGTATAFTVTHDLGARYIIQIVDIESTSNTYLQEVYPKVVRTNGTTVNITFKTAPANGHYYEVYMVKVNGRVS